MDVLTAEQRHRNMSRIRSENTSIEILLRKALWAKGIRFRKNLKSLPGKPDIAITKYNIAIFCDSEFFHGYDWERKKKSLGNNREYWIAKIENNIKRDRDNDLALVKLGWTVVHFWGKEIKKHTSYCVEVIEELIFQSILDRYTDL